MKVLWLCNIMPPAAAECLGLEASNKEGWVSGLAQAVLAHQGENGIALSMAFPVPGEMIPEGQEICSGTASMEIPAGEGSAPSKASFSFYGFPEDVIHAEKYDARLEPVLKKIVHIAEPDIVHCFGTEYPHTLAMCRIFPRKDRILLGLQGLCSLLAEAYYADLPDEVIRSVTFRDWLKKDSLRQQQQKFVLRGNREREAAGLAGNITGRTGWDRLHAGQWNPKAHYHAMNECLRQEFYGPVWREDQCIPHSVFLSQGDYPLKGLHYMLYAMPEILEEYPDAKVYVAGNSIVEYGTWKQKLKISAYGKYLRSLMKRFSLEEKVVFLGKLDAGQMRDRYLKSSLFVCCSALENSPNSLGEAMLLGMPCVTARVGGVSSLFDDKADGIAYEGYRAAGDKKPEEKSFRGEESVRAFAGYSGGSREKGQGSSLEEVSGRLAAAVLEMWGDPEKRQAYSQNARRHAMETHDRERNYRRLVEIYEEIL